MRVYSNIDEFTEQEPPRAPKFNIGELVWISLYQSFAIVIDVSAYWWRQDEYDYCLFLQDEMKELYFTEGSIESA